MAEQSTQSSQSFLEKVMSESELQNPNDVEKASQIVFRILRDLMPKSEINRVEQELKTEKSGQEIDTVDLWNDLNVMVAFFSRISFLQQLSIGYDLFLLRLKQEAALPENVSPQNVTQAVFSALKGELSQERNTSISQFLPDDGLRQLWVQA